MNSISIEYLSVHYSPEAILLAANDLKDVSSIVLENGDEKIVVKASFDDSRITEQDFVFKLNSAVTDYQLKSTISGKTSFLRQMIIAQAFAPCDNLNEIVDAFEQNGK